MMYTCDYNERDHRFLIENHEQGIAVNLDNVGPMTASFLRELVNSHSLLLAEKHALGSELLKIQQETHNDKSKPA
jgi:hypothetical protein